MARHRNTTLTQLFRRWREKGGRSSARRLEAARREFYRDLWARTAGEVGAEVEDLGDEYLRIHRGTAWTVVRRFEVMLDSRITLEVAGDKPFVHGRLSEAGIPVPAHAVFRSSELEKAWTWIRNGAPSRAFVVKPARNGSAGKGVTTGVATHSQLRRAFVRAMAYDPSVLIEEQVDGDSYRLLFLRGEFLDAIRRESPTLEGDGVHSLKDLIRRENESRLAGDVAAFHLLVSDLELRETLASQGLGLSTVPERGARVVVKRAVNQGSARDASSAREQVHPEWLEYASRAACVMGVEWAGVDILVEDLSNPPSEGGVVNEVNTTPALHHHLLLREPDRAAPVATRLLEALLAPASWAAPHRIET